MFRSIPDRARGERVIHDLSLPLRKRLESRRRVGPYRYSPGNPTADTIAFYADTAIHPDDFDMAPHGSFIDLRIDRLGRCKTFHDYDSGDSVYAFVARLPHGRFMPGWGYGAGMINWLSRSWTNDEDYAVDMANGEAEAMLEREVARREAREEAEDIADRVSEDLDTIERALDGNEDLVDYLDLERLRDQLDSMIQQANARSAH